MISRKEAIRIYQDALTERLSHEIKVLEISIVRNTFSVLIGIIANLLWPKVEHVETEGDDTHFLVTAPALASIFGGLMSGDLNADVHTRNDGFTQTTVIIGMCAAVASIMCPGYRLIKIKPDVYFKQPVPLGATVLMKVRIIKSNRRVIRLGLSGYIGENFDKAVFTERELVMVRVPNDHN